MPLSEIAGQIINGGLVTGVAAFQVGAAESPDCSDIDPSNPLGAATRLGSSLVQGAASIGSGGSKVSGLFPWFRSAGTNYTFMAYATSIYALDGATSYAVRIGMATDSIMQAAILNNMAVIVASGLRPQISSAGSTLASVTAGTYLPTAAKYTTTYAARIWVAGDTANPNTVSSSSTNNPEDFTTANNASSIVVNGGDGDTLKGIVGTKGAMYCFKRNNLYAVIGDQPSNYEVKQLQSRGIPSERGIASDGEGVFFASDDGIFYVSGLNVAKISDGIAQTYKAISDKTSITLAVKGSKLFCFYAGSGSQNTAGLVLDFTRKMPSGEVRGIWAPYSSQPYGEARLGVDNNLYAAVNASTVQLYKLDVAGSAGAGISPYWNSPDMDFGDPDVLKTLARYYIHVQVPTATATLTCQWYANGSLIGSSYSMTIGTTGSYAMPQKAPLSVNTVRGNYLRLKISWTAASVVTIYGFKVFAEIHASGDMPRM